MHSCSFLSNTGCPAVKPFQLPGVNCEELLEKTKALPLPDFFTQLRLHFQGDFFVPGARENCIFKARLICMQSKHWWCHYSPALTLCKQVLSYSRLNFFGLGIRNSSFTKWYVAFNLRMVSVAARNCLGWGWATHWAPNCSWWFGHHFVVALCHCCKGMNGLMWGK